MDYKQLLSKWSEEVLTYSTVVGRVWLTVLFFFRVLMLVVGVDVLYQNDKMVCDTAETGLRETCQDNFFPVLPVHFWSTQIICVSTPTLLYLAYVMHVMYGQEMHPEGTDGKARVAVRKSVVCSYFAQLLVKIILEVAFAVTQYVLYGFVIHRNIVCTGRSWSAGTFLNCYLPGATELTLFSKYLIAVSFVSAALNVLEGLLVLIKLIKKQKKSAAEFSHNEFNKKEIRDDTLF